MDSLLNMPFMQALVLDKEVLRAWDKNQINWDDDIDMIRGAFFSFWSKEAHSDRFLSESIPNEQEGVIWFKKFYSDAIANNLSIQSYYEDLNIHWSDDIDAAQMMAVQTLQNAKTGKPLLVKLFKDKEDKIFPQMLFTKSLESHSDLMERVRSKSEKWDYERLAPLDRCIIEQSLVEVINAQEVPVKVTINEAIELAKQYSTEKSPGFINGLLDSLISDMIQEGKVKKVGRGLID
jgi:N utilization substance protein B